MWKGLKFFNKDNEYICMHTEYMLMYNVENEITFNF